MGIVRRYTPSTPPVEADFRHRANQISLPALVSIVLAGTLIITVGMAFFGLWLSRRRAERKERRMRAETMSIDSGDVPVIIGRMGARKLKKSASAMSKPGRESPSPPKRKSMPLFPRVFSGPFTRSLSVNWSSKLHTAGGSRKNPSWIDADALHGPAIRPQPKPYRRSRFRDSWPLGNKTPTLPKVYHASQGYPYEDRLNEDALFGIDHIRSAYGQLRMYSRILPSPPPPALVISRDRPQHMRTMSTPVNVNRYPANDIQGQPIGPPSASNISPTRSLPTTPFRHKTRQASTDSTLSEILRSTEKRLQEGGCSARKAKLGTLPSKMGTSRENLLDHSELTEDVPPSAPRSSTQPKTPSPKKVVPNRSTTPGHKRQGSEASVASESDSLLDELLFQIPECPSGLTSPSRNQRKQEQQSRSVPVQSARTSISSALSTVYSEDERSEGVRTAVNTPGGVSPEHITAENIKSIMVSPESMADPFSPTARPSTRLGWPGRQNKGQDLFRESLKRSQNLRRVTLGQTLTLPPEVKLPPCPVLSGRRSQPLPPFRSIDYSTLRRPELIASRSSVSRAPSPSSKIPLKAAEAQQPIITTKKLSTIILPPPKTTKRPSSPTTIPSGGKGEQQNRHSCAMSPSPLPRAPSRTSTASPLHRLTHRASDASSIYSQDPASSAPASDPVSTIAALFATPSRPTPTPSPRPPTPGHAHSSSLAATVAELRRMNSCVSSASSCLGGAADSNSNNGKGDENIHPVLRDSVFSPSKRRSGNRHYLSLGATPPRNSNGAGVLNRGGNGSGNGSRSGRNSHGTVSLGGSPKRRVGAVRSVSRKLSVSPVRFGVGVGEEKENHSHQESEVEGEGGGGFKMPRVEFTFAVHEDCGSSGDSKGGKEGVLRPGGNGNVVCTPAAKRRRYESGRMGSQESLGLYDQDGFLISTPARYGGASPVLQVC